MQLREIHIDGFGIFANTRVRGLSRGINVLFGENEFGKTTVLELVRRLMFGFPTKGANANQYPALMGGQYGGSLVCQFADGRVLHVARTHGKSGGPLTVRTTDGQSADPNVFVGGLGNVSESLYDNVFAISLQELQAAKQLQGDDVRNRIYGAGLGLGTVSLSDIKDELNKKAQDLYRPRGSVQQMNSLAGNLINIEKDLKQKRSQLEQYDELSNRLSGLEESTSYMKEEQAKRKERQFLLRNQENLYGTYVELRDARTEREGMGQFALSRPGAMDTLRKLQEQVSSLETRVAEKKAQLLDSERALEQTRYDPALLEQEADIKSLVQGLTQYREARQHLPVLMEKHDTEHERTSQALRELGDGWDEERVRGFALSNSKRDELREKQRVLAEAKDSADDAESKLGLHRQNLRARAGMSLPMQYRALGLAVLALGAVGAIVAATEGQPVVAILSGVVAAIGLSIALAFRTGQGPLRDRVLEELEAEREAARERYEQSRTEWCSLLESTGLSPSLTPEGARELLGGIEDTQNEMRDADETGARIERLRATLQNTTDAYARATASLKSPVEGNDIAANIEVLENRLQEAHRAKATSVALSDGMRRTAREIGDLEKEISSAMAEIGTLLSTNGVSTPEELEELHTRSDRVRTLDEIIQIRERTIRATVGMGAAFDAFLSATESTSPEEIHSQLEALSDEITAADRELALANQEIGSLRDQLKTLASSGEILQIEAKAEEDRQRLQDARTEWLVARIALRALDQAISKYETTRQPEVIRQAQSAFEGMTGGRYSAVLSPLGSTELRVRDRNGDDKSVDELSRGTREQLYLAMRMGLIAQYEQNAEPLPVIMDDILVNFDDERGPLAVKALAEFAEDRQVIVMTCHRNTLELYRQAGATELSIEREQTLL